MPTTQGELEFDVATDEATVGASCWAVHPTSINNDAISTRTTHKRFVQNRDLCKTQLPKPANNGMEVHQQEESDKVWEWPRAPENPGQLCGYGGGTLSRRQIGRAHV